MGGGLQQLVASNRQRRFLYRRHPLFYLIFLHPSPFISCQLAWRYKLRGCRKRVKTEGVDDKNKRRLLLAKPGVYWADNNKIYSVEQPWLQKLSLRKYMLVVQHSSGPRLPQECSPSSARLESRVRGAGSEWGLQCVRGTERTGISQARSNRRPFSSW